MVHSNSLTKMKEKKTFTIEKNATNLKKQQQVTKKLKLKQKEKLITLQKQNKKRKSNNNNNFNLNPIKSIFSHSSQFFQPPPQLTQQQHLPQQQLIQPQFQQQNFQMEQIQLQQQKERLQLQQQIQLQQKLKQQQIQEQKIIKPTFGKLDLILDLDDTLIKTLQIPNDYLLRLMNIKYKVEDDVIITDECEGIEDIAEVMNKNIFLQLKKRDKEIRNKINLCQRLNGFKEKDFRIFSLNNSYYITYIRPNLIPFIQEISKYYNIIIYTNGLSYYADQVLDEIFGNYKNYFFSEIISRKTEHLTPKSLLSSRAIREKTIIIDDRDDVWSSIDKLNILRCKPYNPFLKSDKEIKKFIFVLKMIYNKIKNGEANDVRKIIYPNKSFTPKQQRKQKHIKQNNMENNLKQVIVTKENKSNQIIETVV